jgi:hypothetical protein
LYRIKSVNKTSLSSRKSWDLFAFSSEKNSDFNLRVHLSALITPEGQIQSGSCNFFELTIVELTILLSHFLIWHYLEENF